MKRLSSSAAANQPRSASAVCDPRLRVNFSMTADHDARHRSQRHTAFTADDIAEVRKGMHLYLDFLSKRKFAKISALRTAQAALPMAAFRSKFLDMVRDNQVVLVRIAMRECAMLSAGTAIAGLHGISVRQSH